MRRSTIQPRARSSRVTQWYSVPRRDRRTDSNSKATTRFGRARGRDVEVEAEVEREVVVELANPLRPPPTAR